MSASSSDDADPPAHSKYALLYACLVVVASGFSVGVMFVGTKYAFKDELHLTPAQTSYWNFIVDVPVLFSFGFGLLRDRWRPFGLADRPYLLAAPAIICGCCLLAGAMPRTLPLLVTLLLVINAAAMLGGAALNGMLAELSKQFGMSGRISVAANMIPRFLALTLLPMTGKIVQSAGFSGVCYLSAVLASSVSVLAFYRPAVLFARYDSNAGIGPSTTERESLLAAVKRLLSSRAAMLAALISLLWEFDPGWRTPLFYHYTNTLKLSPSQFELTDSVGAATSMMSSLLYAFLCFRVANRRLIMASVAAALIGCVALVGVHSFGTAVAVAGIVGLSTGLGDAGTADLLYRASPARLEAAAVLLGFASGILAADVADLVGATLYEHGGLLLPFAVTFASNVVIVPLVYWIPRPVFATLEGVSIQVDRGSWPGEA